MKVELPAWPWLPPFLLDLSRHRFLRRAVCNSQVSRPRVYQAMAEVREVRLVVNALRSKLRR